ncbi:MAG: M14 family zinc carboxypeptidase, partial [Gemmatimonadota bacterium]
MRIRARGKAHPAMRIVTLCTLLLICPVAATAQDAASQLRKLGRSDRVDVQSIARSPGGREVLLATVSGRGESSGRPALLVIAGARADHEIGTEVALASVAR